MVRPQVTRPAFPGMLVELEAIAVRSGAVREPVDEGTAA